nr:hypothetical protein BaRGS_019700 [Batillaria attramentaria]KAG5698850.1 hypothetical protein BaRGS_019702 [Batillaria attramentaria]
MVGRVLSALDQSGFAQNTVIVFLGDHGWHLGENAIWGKHTNFEVAIRMPLMMYVPGVTSTNHRFSFIDPLTSHPAGDGSSHALDAPSGHATDELVEAVDLFPTLSELTGLPVPHTCPDDSLHVPTCTEGTSLVPLVRSVSSSVSPTRGVNVTWKDAAFSVYLRNAASTHPVMGYSVRTAAHRYTEWVRYDKSNHRADFSHVLGRELYDEAADSDEFTNLAGAATYSGTVAQLSQLLRAGWKDTLDTYLQAMN